MGTFEVCMIFSPFLSIDRSCEGTLRWSKEQLMQASLHPVQTFDLHSARTGSHNQPCPIHGTGKCDCQLVVLLVYGDNDKPDTLILHGNEKTTRLSIATELASNTTGAVVEYIVSALDGPNSLNIEISI